MADTTITLTLLDNGAYVNPTSVKLSDIDSSFGVRRTDTLAVVVADDTSMTQQSTGVYTHTFTEPADNLTYEYSFEVTYDGTTYHNTYTAAAGTVSNSSILPNTTYYSSQAEVTRLMGEVSVDLLTDDLSSGNRRNVWTRALSHANSQIDLYCHQYHTPTSLKTSEVIRNIATYLTAQYITSRRGNPHYFNDQVQLMYGQLEEIRAGRLTLPNIEERGFMGPVIRNYELELFRFYHPNRVEQSTSTGDSYAGQDNSWEYPNWL